MVYILGVTVAEAGRLAEDRQNYRKVEDYHKGAAVMYICIAKTMMVMFLCLAHLGVMEHSCSCCCSNTNEETLLLCISVYAVSVDVLTHAVDLHKRASR